ncbi:hypothetical protein F2P81_023800 [Scophthalmus maximus]|uniref:Uncharacterized protein n=1 Tax=Scophthalmus maximus TaxID=52904 RepID=A0A6A4RUX2_SCOMX|nr:hypothetical protein F2P81_023800 [Scophthalmus maximus]
MTNPTRRMTGNVVLIPISGKSICTDRISLIIYRICASEGKMNAMIHSRFRERMPSNGSAVSISLLTQENVSCKFRSMRREIRRHVVEWQRI